MKRVVFIGPSLPLARARALGPELHFCPPVQHGSIIDVVRERDPVAIGIVDGYFQQHPSVWHKEILWALHRGIAVYGAASMGALRAAELHHYGMRGVGEIYATFRRGALPPFDGLNDDDEVAVRHGPAESGYLVASDAMVNIRATLAAATAAGIIDEAQEKRLLALAKRRHFGERRYRTLLADARDDRMRETACARLEHWLHDHRVDQKRLDAEALIRRVATDDPVTAAAGDQIPFDTTALFAQALQSRGTPDVPSLDEHEQIVFAALQSDTATYRQVLCEALLTELLRDNGLIDAIATPELRAHADRFRRGAALLDRPSVDRWLAVNHVALEAFDTLMANDLALERHLGAQPPAALIRLMLDRLRVRGQFVDDRTGERSDPTHSP